HHDGDHLDVADLLRRHVHDQVLVLAGHPAVPPLEQVLHGDGHLAESTADEFLELVRVNRVGGDWPGLELQVAGVPEHRISLKVAGLPSARGWTFVRYGLCRERY